MHASFEVLCILIFAAFDVMCSLICAAFDVLCMYFGIKFCFHTINVQSLKIIECCMIIQFMELKTL